MSEVDRLTVLEHTGPWYLMVGLDGKAVRVVDKGAVVAGLYTVVEVVPSTTTQGAVEALRDLVEAGEGVTETRNYDAAVRWRKALDAAIRALPSPSSDVPKETE
jgi:hypothetical protein